MPQNKVSRSKREIKMPRKKLICKKTMLQKCTFYVLLSWNLTNQKCFSRSNTILSVWKGKTDLATSNNPNRNSHENNCSETRRSMVETGKFYITIFPSRHWTHFIPCSSVFIVNLEDVIAGWVMSTCTRENSSHPAHVFFCWNFTFIVSRYYRHVRN